MRKRVFLFAVVAAVLIGGCAKKGIEIEAPKESPKTSLNESVSEVEEGSGIASINQIAQEDLSQEERLSIAKKIEKEAKKIYFDFDKYNIRADQEPRVDYDAKLFNSDKAKEFHIKVEGNCDEWGSDEYNYALGLKRAKSVKEALAARGVKADRMTLISYGKSNPVCTEHTKECWAKNRRVEFEIIP